MDIKQGPENLQELFNAQKIVIPSFQRNYVWKPENIKQMLLDLTEASGRAEDHFFGPVILRSKSSAGAVKEYEVIDGQQRITTSILILSALRDIAHDKRYFAVPNNEVITAISQFLTAPGIGAGSRFKASPLIRDFFESAVISFPRVQSISSTTGMAKQLKKDTEWVRKGYLAVDEFLRNALDQLNPSDVSNFVYKFATAVTQRFQIHSMVVADEADAYRLFESMNYLGMKLDPGDLLKSLVLRRVQENNAADLQSAVDKWDAMWVHLAGYSVSKFLRHFLLSTEDGKVKATHIYPILKTRVMKTPTAASVLLQDLEQNARNYGALLNHPGCSLGVDGVLDQAAKRMNIISDTHRLLLLAILNHTSNDSWRKQAFRAVEYAVFRKVAARDNAQDTENLYQSFAKEFRGVKDQAGLDAWAEKLVSPLLTDDQLKNLPINNCTFVGIQYDPREDLARYANAVYETECGSGWAEKPTLEHLAPQNPSSDSGWKLPGVVGTADNPYEVQIHWWGNLTSLEKPLNSSVGNSEWSKKLTGIEPDQSDGLKKSGFASTKQVCKVSVWNESAIHDRGKWLIESLLRLRSHNWVMTGNSNSSAVSAWR